MRPDDGSWAAALRQSQRLPSRATTDEGTGLKTENEFRAVSELDWAHGDTPAAWQRILSQDPDDPRILTRLVRWDPGYDSSVAGVITHDYAEEVYLLEGGHEDLSLGRTFTAGMYASRRPGMRHGPYRSRTGCLMLEVRYRIPEPSLGQGHAP